MVVILYNELLRHLPEVVYDRYVQLALNAIYIEDLLVYEKKSDIVHDAIEYIQRIGGSDGSPLSRMILAYTILNVLYPIEWNIARIDDRYYVIGSKYIVVDNLDTFIYSVSYMKHFVICNIRDLIIYDHIPWNIYSVYTEVRSNILYMSPRLIKSIVDKQIEDIENDPWYISIGIRHHNTYTPIYLYIVVLRYTEIFHRYPLCEDRPIQLSTSFSDISIV